MRISCANVISMFICFLLGLVGSKYEGEGGGRANPKQITRKWFSLGNNIIVD